MAQLTKKTLDVHLMIVDPDRYIETYAQIGADILTVHAETCTHLHRTLQGIKDRGMQAGVALNPHTPVSVLEDVINDIDVVCIMSVNPGFGGQKFIQNTYPKVRKLREMIDAKKAATLIEIDGGVNSTNCNDLVEAGADVLVAGSFVFSSDNPLETIKNLRQVANA
jgi:ribulose-phosphate 3-epimerase